MRLRHFSCGLKTIEVAPGIRGSYIDEACRQLGLISKAVELSSTMTKKIQDAVTFAAGQWGHRPIPAQPDPSYWLSRISNDHSPLEYSVAIEQDTAEVELRFSVDSQPSDNTFVSIREASLSLTKGIATKYSSSVSPDRFNLIRDVFLPSQTEAPTIIAAWHSCALSQSGPDWKIYLNPSVTGK